MPIEVFDGLRGGVARDRSQFWVVAIHRLARWISHVEPFHFFASRLNPAIRAVGVDNNEMVADVYGACIAVFSG